MAGKSSVKGDKIAYNPPEVDYKIVNLLMQDSRMTLKGIAKQTDLSIDAVKDHIEKMKRVGVIDRFTIHINPELLGLPLSSQVYVKLKNINEKSLKIFMDYLKEDPQVITLISILGSFDLFMVIVAKSPVELEKKKNKIREEFKELIDNWDETVVSQIYKLEEYRF